jgi:uncharacterized protein YodC (DUF2158 family)
MSGAWMPALSCSPFVRGCVNLGTALAGPLVETTIMNLEIGAVVKLKAGGPAMTITCWDELSYPLGDGPGWSCAWDIQGALRRICRILPVEIASSRHLHDGLGGRTPADRPRAPSMPTRRFANRL